MMRMGKKGWREEKGDRGEMMLNIIADILRSFPEATKDTYSMK